MSGTHMRGLAGTNPLGFMAAVGIQVAFESETEQARPRIWWSDDIIPHAMTDSDFTVDVIAKATIKTLSRWKDGPVLKPGGARPKDALNLKFRPPEIREYLEQSSTNSAANLATALVTEGGLDRNGIAKPSHLYFTAGQQSFLSIVSKIIECTSKDELISALDGPWKYSNDECPTLRWDVAYDPSYALSASDPSKFNEPTNPGPEALAVLGLSRYPVFAYRGKTVTQGCSGPWKRGNFSWPLWNKPASPTMVKSLLAHAYEEPPPPSRRAQDRTRWYRSWGVFKVLRSPIRRTDQGGYGTFGPHKVIWEVGQS